MSLLEQNKTKKGQIDEIVTELAIDNNDSKKYKVKAIWNSAVYVKKSEGHLLGLYYLVF